MSMGYRVTVAGAELGSGVASTVEDVCTAVTAALRGTYGESDPEVLAGVLTRSWGPLRHSVLTDGATAMAQGEREWTSSGAHLAVTLWSL